MSSRMLTDSCTRFSRTVESRTLFGFEEADMNVVVAALHSDADLRFKVAKPPITRMICVEPPGVR
jgi:hypothetical protein